MDNPLSIALFNFYFKMLLLSYNKPIVLLYSRLLFITVTCYGPCALKSHGISHMYANANEEIKIKQALLVR